MNLLLQTVGNLVVFVLGDLLPFNTVLWILLAIPLVHFCILLRLPETPSYLVKCGRNEVSSDFCTLLFLHVLLSLFFLFDKIETCVQMSLLEFYSNLLFYLCKNLLIIQIRAVIKMCNKMAAMYGIWHLTFYKMAFVWNTMVFTLGIYIFLALSILNFFIDIVNTNV